MAEMKAEYEAELAYVKQAAQKELEKARQKRMIAAAGARLTRPALAAAVSHWKGSWEADRRQQLAEEVQRNAQGKLGTAEQEMMAMRAQAEAELVAAQQAAQKELERQLELQRVALTGTAEEMLALQKQQEKEKRVEQLAQKATK